MSGSEQSSQCPQPFTLVTDSPREITLVVGNTSQAQFYQSPAAQMSLDPLARQVTDTGPCQYCFNFLIHALHVEFLAFTAGNINAGSVVAKDTA